MEDEKVKLKKKNGKTISVPIDKLSDDDQKYARHMAEQSKLKVTKEQREEAEKLIEHASILLDLDPVANAKLAGRKQSEKHQAKLHPRPAQRVGSSQL